MTGRIARIVHPATRLSRRETLAVGTAYFIAVAAPTRAVAAAASLPRASMEAVLKSAQWDPQKRGTGIVPGSRTSVLLVERALRDRGLLAGEHVDGHYGTATVSAYTRWQRRLGFGGAAANGIPGTTSLTRLAEGRFEVTRLVRPGPRTAFSGKTVNTRTSAMLAEAEDRLGLNIRLDQGSYTNEDPTSAGTHAGGGVVDINVRRWTGRQRVTVTRVLRQLGFAAWLRSPSEGDWPWHIHAVAISDPDLAPRAQAQAGDYYRGRNGLADEGPDTGPSVRKVTWEEYLRER